MGRDIERWGEKNRELKRERDRERENGEGSLHDQ